MLAHYFIVTKILFFLKVVFSFVFKLFLCFRILVGLNNSFSTASIKGSKLLHSVSFEENNLDVANVFLSGFGISLILSALGRCDRTYSFDVNSVEWFTL